jgi:hypothetical protein
MNIRKIDMQYGRLVVFMRHDSAEIWKPRYGLAVGIDTLKNMTSGVFFVRIICSLKRSISCDARTLSMMSTKTKHK